MVETDSKNFKVNLNTFSGPLDVLLDLAKSQKVNLENISITKLANQFYQFIINEEIINAQITTFTIEADKWYNEPKQGKNHG